MGNTTLSSEKNKNPESLESDLIFLKEYQTSPYGEINLFKSDKIGMIAVKNLSNFSNETNKDNDITNITHMIQLYHKKISIQNGMCGKKTKTTLYYEFIQNDIEKELKLRKRQNEFFNEKELKSFLYSIISALAYLKIYNINHTSITPKNILLSEDGYCKITDIQLLTGSNSYTNFLMGSGENCYLSPELMNFLGHRVLKPIFNEEKTNIFSLAVICIELGILEYPKDAYNFDDFTIDFPCLKEKLGRRCLRLYSDDFVWLLEQMLNEDPSLRPSYKEILEKLSAYEKNLTPIKLCLNKESLRFNSINSLRDLNSSKKYGPSPAKFLRKESIYN